VPGGTALLAVPPYLAPVADEWFLILGLSVPLLVTQIVTIARVSPV
jgi:hypothetical protein